jgi:hypothetical protein
MSLRGAKPPIGPYAPRLFGAGDAWALRDSNPGASDYETVSNVVPDGQGADSDGISGPLRTGTDTGRHRADSVRPYNARRPRGVR